VPETDVQDAPATERSALEQLRDDPPSRQRFLKMMGGAGAAGAFATLLAACGSDNKKDMTSSSSSTAMGGGGPNAGDIKIVNYALTLEYVEADFYKKVIASKLFKGSQQDLLKAIGEHEQEHVQALTAAVKKLGGTPAPKPKTKFPLKDAKSVATLAATVENLGAAAYLGQAGNIKSKEILASALSIHSVEARHAAALNTLIGRSPTPTGSFAVPASMAQVLPKVKPFIVA
jgi:rubrerythrin